jgi:hypothetical protein
MRPDILNRESFPDFASHLAKKAAERLDAVGATPGDVFIKFGKRKNMEMLYDEGRLRIQPATYFGAANHNLAIRDDELALKLTILAAREDLIALVSNPQDVPVDIPSQRVDVHLKWASDYWLYCVSSSLTPRLFVDYDADACVIIRDRTRFIVSDWEG